VLQDKQGHLTLSRKQAKESFFLICLLL